jgi:hypothetical protein
MGKGITETVKPSRATYEVLEEMVRVKVQEYIQDILEEEVESFLGRKKSERLTIVDGTPGYWNGHGKPKKFSVMFRSSPIDILLVRLVNTNYFNFLSRPPEAVNRSLIYQ